MTFEGSPLQPKVSVVFAYLWAIFQPLLFGLIGAEVDISTIQPKTIGNSTCGYHL